MINNRETWLGKRSNGIGGSDAATILGLNPWCNNQKLWRLKTGREQAEEIGEKDVVKYGINAESHLIELFKLDYPKFEVIHKDYDLRVDAEHKFLYGSLDGELIEKSTGRRGVLEIKTAQIQTASQAEKWKGKVPDNYFCQVLHYLGVTGFEFAILKAQLKRQFDDEVTLETRHYYFERKNLTGQIEFLRKKEIEFWGFVERDECPPLALPLI